MTDLVLLFLQRSGFHAEVRDRENDKLKAFRRNIHVDEFLFELGLTGHRGERFLIKVENQDQQLPYQPTMVNVKGCGFYFPFPVPTDEVLCSMRLSAMLIHHKGRDFYDAMFLLGQTKPDYTFLTKKHGIRDLEELKIATSEMLKTVDLKIKKRL